jgi:hypothetical protein
MVRQRAELAFVSLTAPPSSQVGEEPLGAEQAFGGVGMQQAHAVVGAKTDGAQGVSLGAGRDEIGRGQPSIHDSGIGQRILALG